MPGTQCGRLSFFCFSVESFARLAGIFHIAHQKLPSPATTIISCTMQSFHEPLLLRVYPESKYHVVMLPLCSADRLLTTLNVRIYQILVTTIVEVDPWSDSSRDISMFSRNSRYWRGPYFVSFLTLNHSYGPRYTRRSQLPPRSVQPWVLSSAFWRQT